MKDILGTNPWIFTIFELEFWSPSITNLKYEQDQNYILLNQQTKEELFLSTFTIWVLKHLYLFFQNVFG
jgi:hypothetical protein